MIPDHSALILTFNTHIQQENEHVDTNQTFQSQPCHVMQENDIYHTRFNVKQIPGSFLNNEIAEKCILELITQMEQIRENQDEIDGIYNKFCNFYYDEMKRWLKSKTVYPQAMKRFRRKSKPYWNDNLTYLWELLCQTEKAYMKCQNQQKRLMREAYVAAQRNFDKNYRTAKRKYMKQKILDIENFSKYNAKEFWENIKKLGPQRKSGIPMSVYDDSGNLVSDHNFVINKWANEFKALYNFTPELGQFDDAFYESCINDVVQLPYFQELDEQITIAEVKKAIQNSKKNKSVGLDNLPYEIFKENSSYSLLTVLFNKIYDYNLVPKIWNISIVKPIPKSSLTDPYVPLQYRGISLLSTVYKLFSSLINSRIQNLAEQNRLIDDAQNGFRKNRSCEDHLYALTSIIRNRKREKLDTFVTFVDYEKAFDRINRPLLFYKLRSMGFGGKMLSIIQSIYGNNDVCVNVNGFISPSFQSQIGVKQGDSLSSTLFNIYINDLAKNLNESNKGIKLNDDIKLASLLYADDLAIISDTEENMQELLNILDTWCKRWRMSVNVSKTKIIHFRTANKPRSNFVFKLNEHVLEYVERYKYLGVVLNENLLYNITASVLADSGKRALAAICTKFNKLKGLGFKTYSRLYHTGVAPILDYASGIWGFQKFGYLDAVQNKAIRYFLGVHRFAPNLAINGDAGWISSTVRRKIEMFRYWNRLINMDDNRITKKIFKWDYTNRKGKGSWNSDIYKLFSEIGKLDNYRNLLSVNLEEVKKLLLQIEKSEWLNDIQTTSKLVNYRNFKEAYVSEPYVYKLHNRLHRSVFAQLRCGILPLKIETGRYTQIPLNYRLCTFCNHDAIEDEIHFLFNCSLYNEIRTLFWDKFVSLCPWFTELSNQGKMKIFMSEIFVKTAAEYIFECYNLRKQKLYVNII